MDTEKIDHKLKQAEQLVSGIKDDALRVKAFELVYTELSGQLVSKFIQEKSTDRAPTQTLAIKIESIVEYSKRFQINNDVDKVLIFGSYLERQENKPFFVTGDIQDCYFKAKEKQPSNIPDKISKNISKGFIM